MDVWSWVTVGANAFTAAMGVYILRQQITIRRQLEIIRDRQYDAWKGGD